MGLAYCHLRSKIQNPLWKPPILTLYSTRKTKPRTNQQYNDLSNQKSPSTHVTHFHNLSINLFTVLDLTRVGSTPVVYIVNVTLYHEKQFWTFWDVCYCYVEQCFKTMFLGLRDFGFVNIYETYRAKRAFRYIYLNGYALYKNNRMKQWF